MIEGGLAMKGKVSGISQGEAKFAMKACVAASLLAVCGVACAADAFVAKKETIGEKPNLIYAGQVIDVSADYKAKFPNGIFDITGSAFNATGLSSSRYKWTPATITADVDEIIVKNAGYGASASAGKIVLKADNIQMTGVKWGVYAKPDSQITIAGGKAFHVEATSASISVQKDADVSVSADSIFLKSEIQDATLRGVTIESSVNAGASLAISAKDDLVISSKTSGNAVDSHALHVRGGKAGGDFPTAKVSGDRISISAEIDSTRGEATAAGVYADTTGGTVSVLGNDVTISAKSNRAAVGVEVENKSDRGADVMIGLNTSRNIAISAEADGTATGVLLTNNEPGDTDGSRSATILGKSISIAAKGENAAGADLWNKSQLTLGNADSDIQVKAEGKDSAYGLAVQTGSTLTVNGKSLTVEATGDESVGIHVQNNTTTATDGIATITVNSEKTSIKADTALSAMSQGRLYVNGDLEADAKDAILARGNALISVNEKGGHTVNLKGDVNFNYDQNTSGTTTDATVIVNLDNAASSWTGNVKTSASSGTPSEDLRKASLALTLSNGASWTPTVVNTSVDDSQVASVKSLKLSDGVINLKADGPAEVEVQELSGTGGTVNVDVQKASDGYKPVGTLVLDTVKEGEAPSITVNALGITADNVVGDTTTLDNLINVIDDEGDDDDLLSVTGRIAEGDVKGELKKTIGADGSVTITQAQNTKLASLNAVNAMAVMAWRHDLNDLGKRMGELRDSAAGVGSWVRFFGSGQEYGKAGASSKRSSIQVGADANVGSGWKVGGAFTYTDGSSTLANGSADNKGYGVAAYGTWMAENGLYVDLVGRYSRLSDDFTIGAMRGKSKNNAWSASAETGWHVMLSDYAFVEPQAELTYGLVSGDNFTTSNGVVVNQDDAKALIGRVGVRTGMHLPDKKGTLYARASLLHDFKGDTGFTAHLASDASVRDSFKDDVGGTYYEMGLGANFNWTPNAYTYLDIERQGGGEIKENWRWNVGFRYVW